MTSTPQSNEPVDEIAAIVTKFYELAGAIVFCGRTRGEIAAALRKQAEEETRCMFNRDYCFDLRSWDIFFLQQDLIDVTFDHLGCTETTELKSGAKPPEHENEFFKCGWEKAQRGLTITMTPVDLRQPGREADLAEWRRGFDQAVSEQDQAKDATS